MGFAAHRQAMFTTIAANKGKALKSTPYSNGPAHGINTSTYGAYSGGCRIPGNRVLMAPNGASAFGIYDGESEAFDLVSPHGLSGGDRFRGAILGNEEISFVIPALAGNVWILDNKNLTAEAGPAHGRSGVAFSCAVKAVDGDGTEIIVLGPSAGTKIGILNIRTQVLTDGPETTGGFDFCQLMPDGRVFFGGRGGSVPGQVYDPVSKTVSTVVADGTKISSRTATLLPDNSIRIDGSSGSRPRTIKGKWADTSPFTAIDGPTYTYTGVSYWYGIRPLPNGDLCIAPGSADRAAFWNSSFPQSLTYSTPIGTPGGLLFAGQLMMPNGKNILIPSRHPNIGIIEYLEDAVGFPESVCCSAYFGSVS